MKRRNDETDESLASDSKKTKLLEENDKNYFQTYSNLVSLIFFQFVIFIFKIDYT